MQKTVYIVFEMYTEGEEFVKHIVRVFSNGSDAAAFVATAKALTYNRGSDYTVELWEVR